MTRARSSIHFWAASRNSCKYGTVLLRNVYEFLPDEIALQIKATLDLLERGVPTGV